MPSKRTLTPADDAAIREALVRRLAQRYHGRPRVAVINEFGLCQHRARVDLLAVTEEIEGYEIKSDLDDGSRLSNQIRVYSLVLHRVTLVGGRRALSHAGARVPEWWGLWEAEENDQNIRIISRRNPHRNPQRSIRAVAEMLWRSDILALLQRHGQARGVTTATRAKLWDRAVRVLPPEIIDQEVIEQLLTRRYDHPWGGSRKVDLAAATAPRKPRT